MVRELIISLYLFVFKILFNLCKLFPLKEKTVGVASFGDNIFYALKAISKESNQEIIILKEKSCQYRFDEFSSIEFQVSHPISFIQSIYHLATSNTILIDNYYGFLAVTDFKPGTTCVQLWHAAGAIKHFGLMDPTNKQRTEKALRRFKQVYDRFDYTVVGSEKMASIFRESFGLTNDRLIRTGIPRTDFFFNEEEKKQSYRTIISKYPVSKNKKVILYAPTFRNNQLTNCDFRLDIQKLYKKLSDDYVLFVKNHPAVTFNLEEEYGDFLYDVSKEQINALLLVTDILISDYSSIPFEFALLERPMIFFAYDMEQYQLESGLINNYMDQMPGPVLFDTDEIVEVIQNNIFDIEKVRIFSKDWNTYSNGNSSSNLAARLLHTKEKEEATL